MPLPDHLRMQRSYQPKTIILGITLAALTTLHAEDLSAGKAGFETNCIACHQLDSQTVGPSMIRVASVYPKDKLPEFLKWAKNPGKKDPLAIEMPSMAHVPDETLTAIHDYILSATKDMKEKKGSPQFAKYREPKRKLPYILHTFMPETSPASVAIILPGEVSLCWDTELCRVRYVWKGSKTNVIAFRREADIEPKPFYREGSGLLFASAGETPTEYHGYRRIEGYPEFDYSIGSMKIRELIGKPSAPGSFSRTFKVTGADSNVVLDLSHEGEATIQTDQGEIKDDKLTLTPAQAANFTLTVTRK